MVTEGKTQEISDRDNAPTDRVPPYFFIREEIKRKLARKDFKFSIINICFYILIHNHNICIYVNFISLKYHHKNKIIVSKLHCTNMLIGEQFKQKFDKVHPFLKLNYCLNCLVKGASVEYWPLSSKDQSFRIDTVNIYRSSHFVL